VVTAQLLVERKFVLRGRYFLRYNNDPTA
jgi:hypothetical protein